MDDTAASPTGISSLYRRAFDEYAVEALWNMRPVPNPTPADAMAITRALRTHGGMGGRRLAEQIERVCRASHKVQSRVLGILGPRFSRDIDIFQDSEARLESVSQRDAEAIASAGLKLSWKRVLLSKREAEVHDSAFRFFPTEADDLFGHVLHPIDLAANKASSAADRREPRDVVDLLTIHETILPLGAVICAAVGRFPGQSPEQMLADINRHTRFTAEEFAVLSTAAPLDIPELHRRIRSMLNDAAAYIAQLPSEAVGFVFLEHGIPVQPDLQKLDTYQRRAGSTGGIWPSSPEISRAMLDRYRSTT